MSLSEDKNVQIITPSINWSTPSNFVFLRSNFSYVPTFWAYSSRIVRAWFQNWIQYKYS